MSGGALEPHQNENHESTLATAQSGRLRLSVHQLPLNLPLKCIAAGALHCVAVAETGRVYTWGMGSSGELGLGTVVQSANTPNMVRYFRCQPEVADKNRNPDEDGRLLRPCEDVCATQCAAGACHTLVLSSDGKVYACGSGTAVGLGAANSTHPTFSSVMFEQKPKSKLKTNMQGAGGGDGFMPRVASVIAGHHHSIATIRHSGALWVWGAGKDGRLGTGSTSDEPVPRRISLQLPRKVLDDEKADAAEAAELQAYLHQSRSTRALSRSPVGSNSRRGSPNSLLASERAGVGMTSPSTSAPTTSGGPSGSSDIVSVCCGFSHTIALTRGGRVFTWGNGKQGSLGHGNYVNKIMPQLLDVASFAPQRPAPEHTTANGNSDVHGHRESKAQRVPRRRRRAVFVAAGAFISVIAVEGQSPDGTLSPNNVLCGPCGPSSPGSPRAPKRVWNSPCCPMCRCDVYYTGKCVSSYDGGAAIGLSDNGDTAVHSTQWPMANVPQLICLPPGLHINSIACGVSHVVATARHCRRHFERMIGRLVNTETQSSPSSVSNDHQRKTSRDEDKKRSPLVGDVVNDDHSSSTAENRNVVTPRQPRSSTKVRETPPTLVLMLGQVQGNRVRGDPHAVAAAVVRAAEASGKSSGPVSMEQMRKKRRVLYLERVRQDLWGTDALLCFDILKDPYRDEVLDVQVSPSFLIVALPPFLCGPCGCSVGSLCCFDDHQCIGYSVPVHVLFLLFHFCCPFLTCLLSWSLFFRLPCVFVLK